MREAENNNGIYLQLKGLLESGRLVHAFCFAGGSSASRLELAQRFMKDLIPDHPEDFIRVAKQKDKSGISTEDIEELCQKLLYKPYGERYVVIIEDAHLMGVPAQNKLLKTLEEPVSPAVIMLLAQQRESLLSTVLSRCSTYQLQDPFPDIPPVISESAKLLCELTASKAPFYKKKASIDTVLSDKDNQRENALLLLEALELLFLENKMTDAHKKLLDARASIRQLHSVNYTLKQMCLKL